MTSKTAQPGGLILLAAVSIALIVLVALLFTLRAHAQTDSSVPLSPPTGLSATPESCGTGAIDLSWNGVAGADSYNVYRDGVNIGNVLGPGPSPTDTPTPTDGSPPSGVPGPPTASFTDSGLDPAVLHSYQVSTFSNSSESSLSDPVAQFSPNLCPQFSISGNSVSVAQGSSAGATFTLNYVSGDAFTVSFGQTTPISGASGSVSPGSCNLSSNSTTCTSTYTVAASANAATGSFNSTVTGSTGDGQGGTLNHSTSVPVTITASNSNPINPSILPTSSNFTLYAGNAASSASYQMYQVTRGQTFVIQLTNNSSYTSCSKSAITGPTASPSFLGRWNAYNPSASQTTSVSLPTLSTDPTGIYVFTVTCADPNNSQNQSSVSVSMRLVSVALFRQL